VGGVDWQKGRGGVNGILAIYKEVFMAIVLKVKWVDKSNQPAPSQRIRQIGGDSRQMRWQHTQEQAIESIERGLFTYYVEKDARILKLDVGLTADGKKYLTVPKAGGDPQLLLDLPGLPGSTPNDSRLDQRVAGESRLIR
jgi:hypothetical protein